MRVSLQMTSAVRSGWATRIDHCHLQGIVGLQLAYVSSAGALSSQPLLQQARPKPCTESASAPARPVVLGIVTVTGAYVAAGPTKHSRAAASICVQCWGTILATTAAAGAAKALYRVGQCASAASSAWYSHGNWGICYRGALLQLSKNNCLHSDSARCCTIRGNCHLPNRRPVTTGK